MTSFKNMMRVAAFGVAIVAAAAAPTKQAQAADRSDVVAGVVGGVLLGSFIAAIASANDKPRVAAAPIYDTPPQPYVAPQQPYYAPAQTETYAAPAQTYYAPVQTETYYEPAPTYYAPPVTFSFGISSGSHYGHRRQFLSLIHI